MPAPVGSLYAELNMKSAAFEQGLLSARGLFSSFGGFLASAGIAAGAAIAVIGIASGKMAMDFQKSMELVRTQAGASQDEVDQMGQAILELAPKVGTSPELLAAALYHVESAGLRGKDALDLLTIAAEGAKVGNADLEATTNALIASVNSGIGGVSNMSDAMGVLNAIVGAGNMRMDDLAAAFGSGILSTAKAFGVSIQSVGAALADMTRQGIPAQDAATRLRMTMSLLGAPSTKAINALKEIGLSSTDLANAMRGPDGILGAVQMLKDHLDASGLSATDQATLISHAFGGGRSSSAILTLLGSLDQFRSVQDQVNANTGTFADAWAATEQTASEKMDSLFAGIEALLTKIGMVLLPLIGNLFDGLAAGVQSLSDIWDSFFGTGSGSAGSSATSFLNGPMKLLSDGFNLLVTTLQPLFDALLKYWSSLIDTIGKSINDFVTGIMPTLTDAFSWFATNVLPIVNNGIDYLANTVLPWLSTSIAGIMKDVVPKLIDGFNWLWNNVLKPLGDFIMNTLVNVVFPAVAAALDWIGKNVIPALQQGIQWFSDNVLPALAAAWDNLTTNILPAVQKALQDLWNNVLQPLWNNVLMPLASFLTDTFGKAWTWLTTDVFPVVQKALQDLWNNVLQPLWNNVLQPIASFLVDTFGKAWDWISKTVIPTVISVLGDLWNNVLLPLWNNVLQPLAAFLTDTLGKAFDWLSKTVLPILKQAWDDISSAVGSLWNDWLKPALDWINNTLIPIIQTTLPPIINALKQAWDDVANAVKSLWNDWLKPALDWINGTLIPFLQNTFGPILAALKQAFDDVKTAVENVLGIMKTMADWIGNTFNGVLKGLQGALTAASDAFNSGKSDGDKWFQMMKDGKQPSIDVINVILGGPPAWLKFAGAMNQTVKDASGGFDTMGAASGLFRDIITLNFGNIGNTLKTNGLNVDAIEKVWTDSFKNVQTQVENVFAAIRGAFDTITQVIRSSVDSVAAKLQSFFDPMVKGFNDAIANLKTGWNAFARFWNGLSIDIPQINIPGVGTVGGGHLSLPNVPYMARGGKVLADGLAYINENGPELVMLPRGAEVAPADQTNALLSGLARPPLTQHIYGLQPDEVERQTQRAYRRMALEWSLT